MLFSAAPSRGLIEASKRALSPAHAPYAPPLPRLRAAASLKHRSELYPQLTHHTLRLFRGFEPRPH